MQEGLPDTIVHFDRNTFPREDPKVAEARAKSSAAEEKAALEEQKRQEAAIKKLQKLILEEEDEPTDKPKRGRPPKNAAPAAQPSVAQQQAKATKSAADEAKRIRLKQQKCKLYFQRFADRLQTKEPKAYPTSEPAIDALLTEIESELASEGGIRTAAFSYVSLCKGLEDATRVFNPLGWDLQGPKVSFAQTIAANQKQWDDLVTEFAIAHAEWFMVGPARRLAMLTYQMINAVDSANKAARSVQQQAPPSEGLRAEGADL